LALFLAASSRPSRFLSPDSYEYITLATHFRAGFLTSTPSQWFDLGLKRTPGYPSLLTVVYDVFGQRAAAVVLVQIGLSILTVWLTYRLGCRLMHPIAGAFAALALAVDPISVILTDYVQPETLFTLLLVAAMLAWVRAIQDRSRIWAAYSGVLFGLGALVRPIGLYVLVAVAPVGLLFLRRSIRQRVLVVAVLLLFFGIPVGLWVGRNASTTGVPILSTIESTNLLLYRAAPAVARDDGIPVATARARLSAELASKVGPHSNAARTSQAASILGIKTMLHHPKGAAITAVTGMARLLGGPGRAELLRLLGADRRGTTRSTPERLAIAAEAAIYGVIVGTALVGLITLARARQYFPLTLCIAFTAYFIVFSAGLDAYSRLRVPMMPQLCLLSGAGLMSLLRVRATQGLARPRRPSSSPASRDDPFRGATPPPAAG
jgi:4-amino-4-deoxy-L-arabinose transferase-like glycosyltransferase